MNLVKFKSKSNSSLNYHIRVREKEIKYILCHVAMIKKIEMYVYT